MWMMRREALGAGTAPGALNHFAPDGRPGLWRKGGSFDADKKASLPMIGSSVRMVGAVRDKIDDAGRGPMNFNMVGL
jgi:hypothetical protein